MYLNPHKKTLDELETTITELTEREKKIVERLNWYDNTDASALQKELSDCISKEELQKGYLAKLDEEIALCDSKLESIRPHIRSFLNPFTWRSPWDQLNWRQRRLDLRRVRRRVEANRHSTMTSLASIRNQENDIQSCLHKYEQFNVNDQKSALAHVRNEIDLKKRELSRVQELKDRVDKALMPSLKEIEKLKSQRTAAESELTAAERFERKLTMAGNSYERRLVHEACEQEFRCGSPGSVISQKKRELARNARNYKKVERRAQEIAAKAARVINTLVIDGNNVCYKSGDFIGLGALKALVSHIASDYGVIVVFDASIRKSLAASDRQIREQLGAGVEVHIVATGRYADETVLDLASSDENSYVISNDRYVDFGEKRAVKDHRVIRHEIVASRIMVHDLDINAHYGPSTEAA